ncbi:MAG: phosphatidylglycerophosphatase A [Bacteroidetes bacterium]|nr:phosphatidylglycerophosphatase A [Bacteroidota bacterium]
MPKFRLSPSFHRFAGSLAGIGYLKPAPGTWGSLAATGAFLVLQSSFIWFFLSLLILSLILSVWSGNEVTIGGHQDPSWFVLDEWAGQSITLLLIPVVTWWSVLLAFLLFRVFDILKPAGINRLQDLPGGWGILMDDVLAGIYAAGVCWLVWGLMG